MSLPSLINTLRDGHSLKWGNTIFAKKILVLSKKKSTNLLLLIVLPLKIGRGLISGVLLAKPTVAILIWVVVSKDWTDLIPNPHEHDTVWFWTFNMFHSTLCGTLCSTTLFACAWHGRMMIYLSYPMRNHF